MSDREIYDIGRIPYFRFWCQKVLPAVYDDSLTYYELLCKVIHTLNEAIEVDNEQSEAIKYITETLQKFLESGFDDYYKEQVERWIDEHLQYVYRYTIGQIFFTLDDSGRLLAHVPKAFEQILFSTPMNYDDQSTYGRLCLTYAFDISMIGVLQ